MSYSWKWHRAHGKAFIQLLKDGKKIASVRDMYMFPQCDCGPEYNCFWGMSESEVPYERVAAYIGGKKIGMFQDVLDAKFAVETELGITTRKPKKQEPEHSLVSHIPAKTIASQKSHQKLMRKWREKEAQKQKEPK
jgi:hypothetical protein